VFVLQARGDANATWQLRHRYHPLGLAIEAKMQARNLGWDEKESLTYLDWDGTLLGGFVPT
jgi:hypothetical protein